MGVFESFSDFLAMDGHGLYVWLSYGLFAICILWLILEPKLSLKQLVKEQFMKNRREES